MAINTTSCMADLDARQWMMDREKRRKEDDPLKAAHGEVALRDLAAFVQRNTAKAVEKKE